MLNPEPILVVEELSKTFTLHLLGEKRVHALAPTSFAVAEGAFLAVIGRSGSGKSSLLKCIYRTYLPSSGKARLRLDAAMTSGCLTDRTDGIGPGAASPPCHSERSAESARRSALGPPAATSPAAEHAAADPWIDLASAPDETIVALRGAEIGYVSQFLRPTPRVTATDLVAAPLVGRGVGRDEARARAAELLRRLDLPADLLDGFPALFSGGEQQRVNLARALIALPRLLLLDEPTSALDAANQATVVTLLSEARAAGTTIVAIFHDLALVRRLADGYLHFREGRLIDSGSRIGDEMEAVA